MILNYVLTSANCQLPHAAVSKDCERMKAETLEKQQSNINRVSKITNSKWSFSDVTKKIKQRLRH